MALPRPILDDRSFEQLRDELIRRIPVYAPEWTDHNVSDPGIALIELFAYLGENLLFRFNQIPETTKLAFLRLLDIPMRAAQPARALVALSTDVAEGVLVNQGSEVLAGRIPFETLDEVRVLPVSSIAVCKARCPCPDPDREPELFGHHQRTLDALDARRSREAPVCYQNAYLDESNPSLDFDSAVDRRAWLAVLAGDGVNPLDLRSALCSHREAPLHLNIGFSPEPQVSDSASVDPCPGDGAVSPVAAAPTVSAVEWQISIPSTASDPGPRYKSLRIQGDSTDGLRREGVVRLRLPTTPTEMGVPTLSDPDLAGTRDFPPALDEKRDPRVVFWLSAFAHDGRSFGRVRSLGVNFVECGQSRRAGVEFLGRGTGQANQRFALAHTPVIANSVVLEVEGPGGWESWSEVDAFHGSDESDRHFLLDPDRGVRFGSGLQGLAPQVGQRIRVRQYRYGGGVEGNVAVGELSRLPTHPDVRARNPFPAHGGAAAESVETALERIPGELRRRDRAVTVGDFRELAMMTPGAELGRAECLSLFHPPTRRTDAAGVVSVVVWPARDSATPDAPSPTRNQLRSVCQWLDTRRLVTTEVYVIPPRYREIAVAVGLQVRPGFGIDAVRHWVELVLRQYLAPLPPYGPSGQGWPLGKRVHGPELEAAALQVEGVEFLHGLDVARRDGDEDGQGSRWVTGSVALDLDEVPRLTEITVVAGANLIPIGRTPPPPEAPAALAPIPVIREVC